MEVRKIVVQAAGGLEKDRLERTRICRLGLEGRQVAETGVQPFQPGGKLTPDSILKLKPQRMRACGLSRQKLSYIRDLAAKTKSGDVDFAALPKMTDAEVIEHLTRVKGIGEWSAQMFLMFALRRPNV